MIDPVQAALVALTQQARLRADPLSAFQWPSEKHARWAAYAAMGIESSLRAANMGAKTYSGAAWVLGCMQGRSELGGVRLPAVKVPSVWGVLVPSHEQQVESSQAALLHWLGNWPHDVAWINQVANKASMIHVATRLCRHGDGTHCPTCSRLKFYSQESPESVLGQRADGWWSDEPYLKSMWQEIRKNCRYRILTWTPLEQSIWEPVEADFGEVTDTEPRHGRVQVTAALHDNRFLSERRKAELIESYRGDPFAHARITGELVDAEGATPWGDLGLQRLQAMLLKCREGEWYDFTLAAAHRSVEKSVRLEVWHEFERDECYYADIDGSLGIADDGSEPDSKKIAKGRDPSGLHVYARRNPRLVARYGGYLVPKVLGHFAARVSRLYGERMLVDVESQGGFGEGVLDGLHEAGYRYVLGGDRLPSQAHGRRALSFQTTAVTRPLYIAAVQDQILHGGIEIASRDVVRSALRMRVDKTGKILARKGMHDEDVILLGRAAYWMGRNAPEPFHVEREGESDMAREIRLQLERARTGGMDKIGRDEAWD